MNPVKAFAVIFFITITALSANAQERYEQMIVTYSLPSRVITISTDTGEYNEVTPPKSESKMNHDVTPALAKVKQLSEQGWELYQNSVTQNLNYFVYHLRRPLK